MQGWWEVAPLWLSIWIAWFSESTVLAWSHIIPREGFTAPLYPTRTKGTPTVYLEHGQTINISSYNISQQINYTKKPCILLTKKIVACPKKVNCVSCTISGEESSLLRSRIWSPAVSPNGYNSDSEMPRAYHVALLQGTKPTKGAGDTLPFSLLFRFHNVSSCTYKPTYAWAAR